MTLADALGWQSSQSFLWWRRNHPRKAIRAFESKHVPEGEREHPLQDWILSLIEKHGRGMSAPDLYTQITGYGNASIRSSLNMLMKKKKLEARGTHGYRTYWLVK